MLRDYIDLPLPVRILCVGSLINRAGSFVLIFLTIYASEEMGFGIGFATACMGVLGLGSMLGSYALAMTIGAPIGGEVLSRFGTTVLWSGTFLIAITAVALDCVIRQSITRRIALASDLIDSQLTSENPVPVASPQ